MEPATPPRPAKGEGNLPEPGQPGAGADERHRFFTGNCFSRNAVVLSPRYRATIAGMIVVLAVVVVVPVFASPVPRETGGQYDLSPPLVETEGGLLAGVSEESSKGVPFYAFYSIPFAEPPVGEMRFKSPQEGVAWPGVRNASTPPPPCPQLPSKLDHSFLYGDEDCLYLNVFTGQINSSAPGLPVLVFIHGGAYTAGRAHRHQPYAFLNEEVVLVTIQYRLGIHGFLSTEDDVLPGNFGLMDQLSALRWVSRNIMHFGGDPQRVTIFGQSAGASSVHLLVLSPKSKDLFLRAIIQSGSGLNSWALGSYFNETAARLAHRVGCEDSLSSSSALVDCLRGVESDKLVMALPDLQAPGSYQQILGPRVDGDLLPDEPVVLAASGKYTPVDLISGYTSHDGAEMLAYIKEENIESDIIENFDKLAPNTIDYHDDDDFPVYLTHRAYEYFLGGPVLEPEDDFVKMLTDCWFSAYQDSSAILHAKFAESQTEPKARTYRYVFSHRGQHSVLDNYNVTIGDNYVSHSDEMFYMFPGAPDWGPLSRPDDLAVRDVFTKLWTNFAATGNPTPDFSLGFTWNPTTGEKQQLLNIVPSPAMLQEPAAKRQARVFLTSLPTPQNRLMWMNNETSPYTLGSLPGNKV